MLRYLIYYILQIIFSIICYLTNWLVVLLFCDGVGELKGIFHLWQTWDDTCDAYDWNMKFSPKWLRYDYLSKYEVYKIYDENTKRCIKKVKLKENATFTKKERWLRYINRCAWLYRNNAYGFAFYLLGLRAKPVNLKERILKIDSNGNRRSLYTDTTERNPLLWKFRYKDDTICMDGKLRWKVYLGWKFCTDMDELKNENRLGMIAIRLWIRRNKQSGQ